MTLRLTTLLAADKTTKRGDRRIGGSATRHGTSKAELQITKITNDGLTRSGTGCVITLYPYVNNGRQWVK